MEISKEAVVEAVNTWIREQGERCPACGVPCYVPVGGAPGVEVRRCLRCGHELRRDWSTGVEVGEDNRK